MCSNDIKGMTPGSVAPALLLDDRARIVADLFIFAEPDSFLLEADRVLWPIAREHLEKFLVADDVEFDEQQSLHVLDVEGESVAVLAELAAPGAGSIAPWCTIAAGEILIANLPRFGAPAFTIIAPDAVVDRIETALGASQDAGPLDTNALNSIRIEHGLVRVGVDTDARTLALEARLERAICFTKGCYIGQETIERATAHGALKKMLRGLRFESGRTPVADAPITMGDRAVGRLTSFARTVRGEFIGLAILHHDAWADGTAVIIGDPADGVRATVTVLPFK